MTDPEPQRLTQSSTLPPAQPAYILRGHSAQVHALHFCRGNLRLISGDADGWVVLWSIPIRRPVAVWKAHTATILGLGSWQDDKIITFVSTALEYEGTRLTTTRHGRDNKLHIWQLTKDDETKFSTILPIEDAASERTQPWLLHALAVNALNFCSFAMVVEPAVESDNILVATPGVQDGYINITSIPSETRVATIPSPKAINTGMIMAIGLHYDNDNLLVLAGYESGHAATWQKNSSNHWQTIYVQKSHSQPILSLNVSPEQRYFYTSSADAIIARHPLGDSSVESKTMQTKHAGQQSLRNRSDGKIFATAGWDGRVRVYSAKSMKELAVLKWHKEGCYALAFADVFRNTRTKNEDVNDDTGLEKAELTVSEQRTAKAQTTHWLAAGSKDGKVSLWDIY